MVKLSEKRPRFGYRRIHVLLRREGWKISRGRVGRLWKLSALRVPPDRATHVCRCEEITLADLEDALATGLGGPNQLKALTRAGMGPCQGRFCALTLQEIVARRTGQSMAETGHLRLRPPVKPITLAELADMETAED